GFEEVEKIEVRREEKVRTRERIAPRLLWLLLPPFHHRRPPCFDHVLIPSPFHSLERGFKSLTPQYFVSSASGNSSGFPTARTPAVTAHNSLLPRFEGKHCIFNWTDIIEIITSLSMHPVTANNLITSPVPPYKAHHYGVG
ncbi:hypothetical protein Lal_00004236, partial [Lupinus albus]